MENYEKDIFEFGNVANEELEQTDNFYYDSIIGLGESNYENEDLFNTEVDYNENLTQQNDFRINSFNDEYNKFDTVSNELEEEQEEINENEVTINLNENQENTQEFVQLISQPNEITNDDISLNNENLDSSFESDKEVIEEATPVASLEDEEEKISISDTPIEELKELTQYEEEEIEETDINSLFDRVSVNVKDASDIFRKNTDLKSKIDARFEELKKLQSEIENSKKTQIDEINAYKNEVYSKLTEKKEEIEKRLNLLKETQAALEKERQEFEAYKKMEQQNIDRVQKEVQSAYDDRREELSHIEDVLRKQKDALDEERNQLSLDRIEYEADKNELANNLLKFNELVNSFTNGVDGIKE